ncbi:efflux RND transporter periplasmic adaptor subunit [Telluria antibiotica]|uniref:efflux RND transporter periplasmic adaptor subunit n=1 Tax=Telluria antibiotica TaxID=2717319 RepID=UPI003530890D
MLAQATKPSPPEASAAPVKLDTVTARRGDFRQTVDAAGKLQLHTWADAYARIGGQVKEVLVAIGDTVQVDQALLDSSARPLKAQNATREDAFESARMNASSANARVDAIAAQIHEREATLKIDEEACQKTLVRSPIAGTVVSMAARVAESDVTRLRPGMAASFTTPGYPGKHWSGTLRQVTPIPDEGTGEQGKQAFYTVLFEVKNADHELMSGMSAQVQFVVAQARDTLLLPANGLGAQDEDGQYRVNALDAGQHVAARKVKVGLRNVQQVQILSGLAPGDKVLVGSAPDAGTKSPAASGS